MCSIFYFQGGQMVRLGVGPILSWFRPKTLAPTSGLSQAKRPIIAA